MQSPSEILTELYVCGNAQCGQLGLGDEYKGKNYKLPKICSYRLIITKISCGGQHSCFVTEKGHIYSMGSNEYGQLGIGNNNIMNVAQPTLIESLSEQQCISVKTGSNHTIALTSSNDIYSWGQGYFGALGTGFRSNSYAPKKLKIHQDQQINKISCGDRHSGLITSTGSLLMMGSNESGQCGIAGFVELLSPTLVNMVGLQQKKQSSIKQIVVQSVSCGYSHSLVLVQNNQEVELYSFGCNQFGQLGLGQDIKGGPQISLVKLPNVRKIKASNFSVALTSSSELFIWGCTVLGEFYNPTKVNVPKNAQLSSISLGASFGCVLDINGGIYTWGKNSSGELALGDEQPRNQIIQVNALKKKHIKKISCGYNFLYCLSDVLQKDPLSAQLKDQNKQPKGILKKRNTDDTLNNLVIDNAGEEEVIAQGNESEDQFLKKRRSISQDTKKQSVDRKYETEKPRLSQASLFTSTPPTKLVDKQVFIDAIYAQNQDLLQELKDCKITNLDLEKDVQDLNDKNREQKKTLQFKDEQIREIEFQKNTIERQSKSSDGSKDSQIQQLQTSNQKLVDRINQIIQEKSLLDDMILDMERNIDQLQQEKSDYKALLQSTENEFQLNLEKLENCILRLDQKQVQINKQKIVIDQLNNNIEEIRKRQQFSRDQEDQKYTLEKKCNTLEIQLLKTVEQLKLQEEKNQHLVKLLDVQIAQKTEEFKIETFQKIKLDSNKENSLINKYLNPRQSKIRSSVDQQSHNSMTPGGRPVSVDDLLDKQRQIIDNSANKLRDYLNQKKNQIIMIELDSTNRQTFSNFES